MPGSTVRKASAVVRARWRSLATFALLFRLPEWALFAPTAAIVGHALLGRPVVDSTVIVAFLLSPRGARRRRRRYLRPSTWYSVLRLRR